MPKSTMAAGNMKTYPHLRLDLDRKKLTPPGGKLMPKRKNASKPMLSICFMDGEYLHNVLP